MKINEVRKTLSKLEALVRISERITLEMKTEGIEITVVLRETHQHHEGATLVDAIITAYRAHIMAKEETCSTKSSPQ